MKANRKFVEGEEAVSAVIGVILMVAITVAIAATVYMYVSGMIGGGTQSTPSVSIVADPVGFNCTITVGTPTANDISWSDVGFTIVDLTNTTELTNGSAGGDSIIQVLLPASNTMVQGGQIITVKYTGTTGDEAVDALVDDHQYRFTLSYDPTGGTMGTVTWTQ